MSELRDLASFILLELSRQNYGLAREYSNQRNTLIGPGVLKFDASVFKNNRLHRFSESTNVQFRAEFFNLFNRANFSSPTSNLAVFDQAGNPIPTAGLITSTQTPSREIQFALKVIW